MRAAFTAILMAMSVACASNPTPRCEVTADCAGREACYRGLCLPENQIDGGSCASGELRCRDECVDPMQDRDHCGRCDHRCRDDEDTCVLAVCVES